MKKITDFIVDKRNYFLILFAIITGLCLYTSKKVTINSDITKYLPSTSETKIGNDIMKNEFEEQKSSTLNVMFKDLSDTEKEEKLEKLKNISGVDSVDYDNTEEYNKGEYTLYRINVKDYDHSDTAKEVYNTVKDEFKPKAMSGSIYDENATILHFSIVVLAIAMAMVILIILSESYVEPFLYLISIGVAVFINKGTNIMFDSVSNITDSITAILQLALSMDYSIMLSNRYRQEREIEKDKLKAMKRALYDSFKAISSSSVTTIAGLIALVFMSFTIGKDLGFVLAKGVLFSLVSIFCCLPGLLLLCDKLIIKTHKKSPQFNLEKIGKYSYKTRWFQLAFIVLAFVVSYGLKDNLGILYTDSQQDEVGKIFPETNQIAIVYENKYDDEITDYVKAIEDDEKANQVLCYGNTINQKLAYNELNEKFKDLGQDTEIEEYLLKIIYYNYYNKENNDSMTFDEFIKFIKSDVYTNKELADSVDNDVKENIDLLENFTTNTNINKKRTTKELADILGMSEEDAKNLLIYYNSKNLNTKITLKQFVDFMFKDVLTDSTYSSSIDENTRQSLEQLKTFTDTSKINKKMTSKEIANTYGISEDLVKQLFLFYRTTQDSNTTMTMNEFANFTLKYVATNPTYKSMFTEEQLNSLKILQTLSNNDIINKEMTANEMSEFLGSFGLSNDMVEQLYKFYAVTSESNSKLTLGEFANIALQVTTDANQQASLNTIVVLTTNYNKNLPASVLYSMFGNDALNQTMVEAIVANYGENNTMTPQNFVNVLLGSGMVTDETSLAKLNQASAIMSNAETKFSYKEIASVVGLDTSVTKQVYGLYDYGTGSIKLSPKGLINYIIANKENELIKDQISNYTETLNQAYFIMNNANKKLSYKEMSSAVGIDANSLKSIYGLYDYNTKTTTMTPKEFAKLILNNKNNTLLKNNLNKSTLEQLELVNRVMDSTLKNTKYTSSEMSELLGIDNDTLSLLFSLYDSKYIKANQTISLLDYTNFIISDVIPNPTYNSSFDADSISKLNTVNGIMKNTLKGSKYNSRELYAILNKLTDNLDYNLVDLVYIYHGSVNSYDDSWKLTVEEIVNYLNNNILHDERFTDFMDDEMTNKIKDAKVTIDDAKKLLVSDKYSRAILNTKYPFEGEETFNFIQDALEKVGNKEGVYVIGDSPMALEISKTFNDELNNITIITVIFIFVVVAITFKSLVIPTILVLIIQCAVYVTMAILSVAGSSVYFISLIIVQAILMGATIDYAIVYTTYYKESRATMDIQNAIINAYNKSIHTILSSSSILIIVTLIVASFASAIAAKICETISQGTLCAVILVIFVLPSILAVLDKFVCKDVNKKIKQ